VIRHPCRITVTTFAAAGAIPHRALREEIVMPRTRPRGERGASAVEFALVVPVLLLVLFGIIDFGFAVNRYAIVNNAAREGVREASLGATEAEIRAAVTHGMSDLGGSYTVTVGCKKPDGKTTCTSWNAGAESGGIAEVKVDFTHEWITPVGDLVGGGEDFHLAKTNLMRIE
jgi:Flp pilus assembly protein TadG